MKTLIQYEVEELTFDKKVEVFKYELLVDEYLETDYEADNFLDGSDTIKDHMYESAFGFLLNWWIVSVTQKNVCDIGADKALAWWPDIKKLRDKHSIFEWKIETHDQGWLDPHGKFYEVYGFGLHNKWAYEQIEKIHGNFFELGFSQSGSDYLEQNNWIRILNWSNNTITILNCKNGFRISNTQMDFLFHFAYQYNLNLDEIVDELEV